MLGLANHIATWSKDQSTKVGWAMPKRSSPKRFATVGSMWGEFGWVEVLTILPEGRAEVVCNRSNCGHRWEVLRCNLVSGRVRSCGCYRDEVAADRSRILHTTHGHTINSKESPTFLSWKAMRTRCYNQKHVAYHNYGGRGVKVCEEWVNSFEAFLRDMGVRPDGLTLDRIDNNMDYTPFNCKWSTKSEQRKNQRPRKCHTLKKGIL